jgi:aldose 1-epimerase
MCSAARGQVLIPWPNRLRDGRYGFEGEEHQLALSEPDKHNAIHGLVRWVSWQARELQPSIVRLGHVLNPQPGYPFRLDLEVGYEVSENGLQVELAVRNDGDRAAPVGIGQHPYLLPVGDLEDVVLHLPARSVLATDERQIPTGTASVEGGAYDFRSGRRIAGARLDTAYLDLERDPQGRFWLRFEEPSRSLGVWLDEHFRYVMAFTGDTLPDAPERRRSLGVEPMSCPPNALQTGDHVVRLDPGEAWRASWGIVVDAGSRAEAGRVAAS